MNLDTKPGHPWNHGVCAFDCGDCIRSCCCPCFLFGRTSYRLAHRDDPEMKGYHRCNISCIAWCGLCLAGCIPAVVFQALRRCAMRQEFIIDGDPVKDSCASFWCQTCALVQEDVEARDWQKRKAPYAEVQPAPHGQMAYPPPQPQHPPAPGVASYGTTDAPPPQQPPPAATRP